MKTFHNENNHDVVLTVEGKSYDVPAGSDFSVSDDPNDPNADHFKAVASAAGSELKQQDPSTRVAGEGDVLIVRDSANTTHRAVPANRDRSAETLTPQPGPVVTAVNGVSIEAPHVETQTVTPEEAHAAGKEALDNATGSADLTGSKDTSRVNVSGLPNDKAGKSGKDKTADETPAEPV